MDMINKFNHYTFKVILSYSTTVNYKIVNVLKKLNTVCLKKRLKCFLCNIFYKTPAIVMKFGAQFPE